MREGQNIKVNLLMAAGSLLLLAFLIINPVIGNSVYADEAGASVDDEIMLMAETPSTIGVAFTPTTGSASLSPTTSAGQSAQVNVLAKVSVQNSGGYSVYLKSSSMNLVGMKSTSNIIPGATTAKTYADMDVNTWGYYAGEGSAVPEGAIYKGVSVSGNGDKVAENTSNKIISETKNVMLSFAAKVNDQKPADTYQNTVTLSVVSSPLRTTLTDITEMQSMTSEICGASALYETTQLKDTRDGKYYWVTKLADNKCWMTQNLDLDLSTSRSLTSADSDVTAGWAPGYDTATVVNASTVLASDTGTRSWSLGDYRMKSALVAAASPCAMAIGNASDCTDAFSALATPTVATGKANAHYLLGNHYQWNAATAGTGGAITSGQAASSICAKGWRLPTSGEMTGFISAGSIGSSVETLLGAPYYYVRTGFVGQSATYYWADAGNGGTYWTSTPQSNGTYAVHLSLSGADSIKAAGWNRRFGMSVRCVAR